VSVAYSTGKVGENPEISFALESGHPTAQSVLKLCSFRTVDQYLECWGRQKLQVFEQMAENVHPN